MACESVEVLNPYDESVVASMPAASVTDANRAVDRSAAALDLPLSAARRAEILRCSADAVADDAASFVEVLIREAGKPRSLAEIEVQRASTTLRVCAEEADRLVGATVPSPNDEFGRRHTFTMRVPIGVVLAITPFNFPLNLVAHKVGPALAAGNSVVLKPAEKTPSTALLLARHLFAAGLPEEWLNVVVGDPQTIVDAVVARDEVRFVGFTGSSEVGWDIRARSPRRKVALELGNSAPVIVGADADLDRAAAAIVNFGYGFSGQSCVSPQRVIAHRSVYADLRDVVLELTERLGVGDPSNEATVVGPVISRSSRDRILGAIAHSVTLGAVEYRAPDFDANVIAPVLLGKVGRGQPVWDREVFGPVVGMCAYDTADEAVALANDTIYGLQAAVFTDSISLATEMIRRLDFGGVIVNDSSTFRMDHMPYGGTKASGNTKEGPRYAMQEMTEERTVVISS
jgi:acyl-CoA reductase-like NAD-dependent aldehyde dehydrogenase